MQPPSLPRGIIVDYVIEFRVKGSKEYISENVGSNATFYLLLGLKEFEM